MSLESDLRAYVIADATVAGLIGARMHPNVLPENGVFPATVYKRVMGITEQSHDGSSQLKHPHYQFDLYTRTKADIDTMLTALERLFLGYSGTMGATKVGAIHHVNDFDGYEPETRLYRGTAVFEIWHQT